MIAVLQIILKILGIILLSILGIFIVLLLMTLFIPVRYRIQGNYKNELKCRGKVTWLFHLVSVSFIYEKGISTSVRILGIPLSVFKKKNVATKLENSKAKIKKEDTASFVDTPNTEDVSQPITLKDVVTDETTEKTIEVKSRDENNTEKISIINKIKNKISSIKKKILSIYNKLRDIVIDILTKKETLEHYISILRKDEVKKAFSLCKRRLGIMLKKLLPRKMKVVADFGFEDPSITGYILAICGMLPASIGKKFVLHPDFEKSIFCCDYKIKGAVRLGSLLHQLLCIISDKNCLALYHIVKKEILNERK